LFCQKILFLFKLVNVSALYTRADEQDLDRFLRVLSDS